MILGNRWTEVPLDQVVKNVVFFFWFSILFTVIYIEEKDS